MRIPGRNGNLASKRTLRTELARFRHDDAGANAIEFAAVSIPFLIFVFGLIGLAFNFFIQNSIENGMSRTSRLIRTGEAQTANMTVSQFKNQICSTAGAWVKCDSLQVFVEKYDTWADAQPHNCIENGNAIVNSTPGSTPIATSAGTASEIVIVTGCYKWDFTRNIPFVKLGNMDNGKSLMMQTMTAFRAEPYTPPN
jgi:Flp pilus assembly protein TadG